LGIKQPTSAADYVIAFGVVVVMHKELLLF